MHFGETVERARGESRRYLLEAAAQHRADGRKVILEPVPRMADGSICFAPDGLQLPLRYDFVYLDEAGEWHPGNADSHSICFGDAACIEWEHSLKITFYRIAWDYLKIDCIARSEAWDWQVLKAWFLNWFDPEDAGQPDADGLNGVVHFISDPEITEAGFQITVDLGSGSIGALGELFDALISLNVTSCKIGSSSN